MAARESAASGAWSAVGTWDGGLSIPAATDTVTIKNTHTVIIDDAATEPLLVGSDTGSAITVASGGILSIAKGAGGDAVLAPTVDHIIRLQGLLTVQSGGECNLCTMNGATVVPIPIDRKVTLQIDCSAGTPSDGKHGLVVAAGGKFRSKSVNPWGTSIADPDRCFLAADSGGYCNVGAGVGGKNTVTRLQGEEFSGEYVADAWMVINGTRYQIDSVTDVTNIILKAGGPGALPSPAGYTLERTTKTFTTDVSTAWKDKDKIAVASTSRLYTDCEAGTMNGAAVGATITVNGFAGTGGTPKYAHIGVAMYGGIASYDHTGGTYERMVTAASGMPFRSTGNNVDISPLADGTALTKFYLDGVYYTVDEVKSATVLTLTAGSNPGGDLTSKQFGIGNPCKAEVINLTRNILITGYGTTYVSYAVFETTATVDIDWTEFAYMGEAATDKYGVTIKTTTGSCSLTRCSFHDFEDGGIYVTGSAHNNWTVSNSVMWNLASVTANYAVNASAASTGTNWTINNNIVMYTAAASCHGINLSDIGGTVTNNTVVGARGNGFNYGEGNMTYGVQSGNVAHSNGNYGKYLLSGYLGLFSNGISYRNANYGLYLKVYVSYLNDFVFYGNTYYNLIPDTHTGFFKRIRSYNDTVFAVATNVAPVVTSPQMTMIDSNLSLTTTTGILSKCTTDIVVSATFAIGRMELINTSLEATNQVSVLNTLFEPKAGHVRASKLGGTSGVAGQKSWYVNGAITADTTYYRTASPSQRLTPASPALHGGTGTTYEFSHAYSAGGYVQPRIPNNYYYIAQQAGTSAATPNDPTWPTTIGAMVWDPTPTTSASTQWRCISPKLQSDKKQFAIDSAGDATVTCYVKVAAAYLGNRPRLVVLANPEIGILTDTVLATFGNTVTVASDGVTVTRVTGPAFTSLVGGFVILNSRTTPPTYTKYTIDHAHADELTLTASVGGAIAVAAPAYPVATADGDAGDTATGTFHALSGLLSDVSVVPTANGVIEVCVDCDGVTGFVDVDDWSVS